MIRTFLLTPKGWQAEKPIEYWTEIFGDVLGGNGVLPPGGIDLWFYDLSQKWNRYAGSPYPSNLLKTMVDISFEYWKALYEEFPAPDADLSLEIRRLITRYDFWFYPPRHNVFCLTYRGWVTVEEGEPPPNYVECYTRKFVSYSDLAHGCTGVDDNPHCAAKSPSDLAFVWSCKFDNLAGVLDQGPRKALHDRYPAPAEDLREFIEARLARQEAGKAQKAARNEEPESIEKPNKRDRNVLIAAGLLILAIIIAVYMGFTSTSH
jgi:hypothetical protein